MEPETTCPACLVIWKLMVLATMGILIGMAWVRMASPPPPPAIEEVKS